MSSPFTISLLFFSIKLLISISHVSEAAPVFIVKNCAKTKPFLPNSTYLKNLESLLSSLSSSVANSAGDNSSSSGGFTNAAAGQNPTHLTLWDLPLPWRHRRPDMQQLHSHRSSRY
ncbi:hypothetical protein ACJRO7_021789 [Eucalyptus globulus]|uniref:Uncharacterized protein n=1 Tax=Eucalyptus globulus TaxID=34317 RepID=A0ABD3KMG2_EUCGL